MWYNECINQTTYVFQVNTEFRVLQISTSNKTNNNEQSKLKTQIDAEQYTVI